MAEKTLLHLTADDLATMTIGDIAELIERVKRVRPNAKFSGTAAVLRADGTVKYDEPQPTV
jgi:hypothetical protein